MDDGEFGVEDGPLADEVGAGVGDVGVAIDEVDGGVEIPVAVVVFDVLDVFPRSAFVLGDGDGHAVHKHEDRSLQAGQPEKRGDKKPYGRQEDYS